MTLRLKVRGNQAATDPGPKLFPLIAGIGLLICAICILLQKEKDEKPFLSKKGWLLILILAGSMGAYVVCLKYVGFLICTPFLLFGTSTLFSTDKKVPVVKRLGFSLVVPVILYVIFVKALNIQLPNGILPF
jgi:putative tricarboxylic transport membrane protein